MDQKLSLNYDCSFIEYLSDGIIILKGDKIIGINKIALEKLGGDRESYLNHGIQKYINVPEELIDKIKTGSIVPSTSYSGNLLTSMGLPVSIEYNISRLNNDMYILIMNDINNHGMRQLDYVNNTKKYENSEKIYKWLLGAIPDGVLICDKNLNITYANNSAAVIVGQRDYKELIGRNLKDIINIHPEYKNIVVQSMKSLLNGESTMPFLEQKLIKNNGEVIIVEVAGISFCESGNTNVMLIVRNITERKQAEQELVESNDRYAKLVDMCPDGVFVFDEERIIFANQAGANMLNAPCPEAVIGKKFMDFTHPDFKSIVQKRVDEIYINNIHKKALIQDKMIALDGTVKDIEITNIDFYDKGKKLILNMVRDLTERRKAEENKRQLEEALEYDKIRTEFFSNISHEFKTPLNIILGALQLIDSMHGNNTDCIRYQSFRRYSRIIKQNCYRLLRLINNLIDITRLDAGFLQIKLSNHDIVSAVEDIVLSVAEYTKSKDITLTFDTDVEEKIMAFDPDKIERVILNLLSNAIKFNKPGGSIDINMYDKGNKVIISIKDTGIGIPEDMKEKIFERFRRVDNLFTRSTEGSGIGLSLVKSLIEAHGGNITVQSEQEIGSEFIIELPVKLVSSDEAVINDEQLKRQVNVERINIEFSDIYS
ncbi:sensor histidine kinase [Fonticella tunisiensis]|uniref:histidine kinase n=1 Tax=Fonticella tunisiensis TaxID=1096341 RepID=A0A4R7K9X5_9CLOT|nr:PAS domain-containing sensor histidine kinase [Fonticella tunisiensis]TDT51067.1 PAS domain S-box-containing protein [Fonticella tunisiensis]